MFSGTVNRLHTEDDEPDPLSNYGLSKLLGEWFAGGVSRHYVLRLASLFGGARRVSRIDRIADALRRAEPTPVFVDRTVTPSYVPDVVEASWTLVSRGARPGVYHCVSTGSTTWAELAAEIAGYVGASPSHVVPVRVADVSSQTRRPQYAALSNEKLAGSGIAMPPWRDAVHRHLKAWRASPVGSAEHAR